MNREIKEMENVCKKKTHDQTYMYEYLPHGAYPDEQGDFYCRAVNSILNYQQDEQVCGAGCPCCTGTTQGTKKGFPECSYYDIDLLTDYCATPQEIKHKIDSMLILGMVPLFPEVNTISERMEKAFAFSAQAHLGQVRKGTKIPYFTHIISALNYAVSITDDEDTLIAIILHDTVEDTDVTLEEIEEEFGKHIAKMLEIDSEDKREGENPEETWEIRKKENIENIRNAPEEVKILALCDKTANLESMVREYHIVGDKLWDKFHQKNVKMQAWYFEMFQSILSEFSQSEVMKHYKTYMDILFS